MTAALRSLLNQLIDYAGLFPPARLELAAALDRYLRHRGEPEAWLLARFIVPAVRLDELEELLAGRDLGGEPLRLSVLFGGGVERAVADDHAIHNLRLIEEFQARHEGVVSVEALETRLPEEVAQGRDRGATVDAVADLLTAVGAVKLPTCDLAVESPGEGEPAGRDGPAIAALAAANAGRPLQVARLAYKVRCGGVEPAAFPTVERLAGVLAACRDAGLALKATAGLHHPLPTRSADPPATMHGFLNLFAAGLLVYGAAADEETAAACLAENDPGAFEADDAGFGWRGRRVATAEIARLRREKLLGFGSCSFDEPRDDLRALGLLD